MSIATTVRNEWRVWSRNRLLSGLSLLFLGLSLYAGINGRVHQERIRQARQDAEDRVRIAWENQRDKNPHSAAHFGTYVFKPISPLWFFDHGVDRYVGVSLFLEGHRQHDLQHKPIQDDTALGRHNELTPAFFLTYLMPLLVILAAYGSVSGERDRQTLPLVYSMMDRRRWIVAKWSASAILVSGLVFAAFLIQAAVLWTTSGTLTDLMVLAALALVYVVYGLVFLTICMLVSGWSRSTSVSFAVSVVVWVIASFLLPRLVSVWSEVRYPLPSAHGFRSELARDLREGVDGHDPFSETATRLLEETLTQHGVDKVEDLPFNWSGYIMQEGEKHESAVYQRHMDRLSGLHLSQIDLHRQLAWLSPVGAMRLMSMEASGTGLRETYRFRAEAEQYRMRLVGELNRDLMDHFEYGDWDGKRSASFFATNVTFRYPEADRLPVIRAMAESAAVLLGWLLVQGIVLVGVVARRSPV